mgnify:CR=1 FL=1
MKTGKLLTMFFLSLIMAVLFGNGVADATGLDAGNCVMVSMGVSVVASFLPTAEGILSANMLNIFSSKELIKKFRHKSKWLERIPSKNQFVGNDVIRIPVEGVDPEWMLNNTTYPITSTAREDDFLVLSLHKYSTKNTHISDDEAETIAYDKPGSMQMQHRKTLEAASLKHSLHSFAPAQNTATQPVLETTGGDDGSGRKRATHKDVMDLEVKLSLLDVPLEDRILVLSAQHWNDLILEDKTFSTATANYGTNQLPSIFASFEVYKSTYSPIYDSVTKEKKAFASIPAVGDRRGSIAIYLGRSGKATGTAKRYLTKAENDTANRKTTVGFRLYHLAFPLSDIGFGAMIDGRV